MPPDSHPVEMWLEKAEHDRSAANRLFTPGCIELAVIGFLCQQAIEKFLKAWLVSRNIEPEYIHDLRRLADACAALDASFVELIDAVSPITAFAIVARYPGPAKPQLASVQTALRVVEEVRQFVMARL